MLALEMTFSLNLGIRKTCHKLNITGWNKNTIINKSHRISFAKYVPEAYYS